MEDFVASMVLMVHGRYSSSAMYGHSSRMGPRSTHSCWIFAARRVEIMAGEGEPFRVLSATVYRSMAGKVARFRTIVEIVKALMAAFRSGIARCCNAANTSGRRYDLLALDTDGEDLISLTLDLCISCPVANYIIIITF